MLDRNEMILRDDRQQAMAPYMPPRQMQFAPPPEPEEASLLASIFRHLWLVVLFTAMFIVGACVYLNKTTPLYSSAAKILISTSTPMVNSSGDGAGSSGGTGTTLDTQCTVIRSAAILSGVADRPDVARLNIFQGSNPIQYLRDHVEAEVGRKDESITVTVTTPSPTASAVIANTIIEIYTTYQKNSRTNTLGGVARTLKADLDANQKNLEEKNAQLESMRAANPMLLLEVDQNAGSMANTKLSVTRNAYAEAQSKLKSDELIYGPGMPQIRQDQARAESANVAYREALNDAMAGAKNDAAYIKLKSDVDLLQKSIAPMRERIKQLDLQTELLGNITSINILDPALPAGSPTFPQKFHTLALAAVLGLVVGGFFAFLRDRTDGRLRTADEIQNMVGLTILGVVPRMPGRRTAVARAMAVHLDPRSEVAEAYRTIRTAVYFGAQGSRARTLLVTSPEAGDGKTTSASNLAIAIAQTGRSVLLLDADFRKPTQHKNLDVKDNVGLSSVLSGTETLDRAIQRTGVDGLDILPCGAIPGNPSEILNSQEFGELVDRLALKYDHIIFDSPPVNLVTDARILGAVCDATVLVLRADKSTRKAAEHARNALLSVGSKLLGAVVNDVPKGKGYDTYGGSYYGTQEMRPRGDFYPTSSVPQNGGPGGNYLNRLPRSTADMGD